MRAKVIVTINNNIDANIDAKTTPKPFFLKKWKRPFKTLLKSVHNI